MAIFERPDSRAFRYVNYLPTPQPLACPVRFIQVDDVREVEERRIVKGTMNSSSATDERFHEEAATSQECIHTVSDTVN